VSLSRFRPLGPSGAFPPWFRALKGKSGVYVIQGNKAHTGQILYVGESHTGRLKKTLARHFQAWRGETAGPTYRRAHVLVAVEVTPDTKAVEIQNRKICEMQPRDNKLHPGCEPDHHPEDQDPF
jgi:hypothetical protein